MGDIRDYQWAFPLVGGVIALLALLTPVAYFSSYSGSMNIWMWGLFSIDAYGYGSITRFTQDPGEITLSLISSAIVLICTIAIISSAASCRRNMRIGKIKKNAWLPLSIMVIVGTALWMIGMEALTYAYGYSFWSAVSPGFGVIGTFLGAILSIIGFGVSKMSPKETREVILPMKKEFIKLESQFIQPGESTSFKFCPNCGQKIISQEQRFCTNCGFELKGIPMTQF